MATVTEDDRLFSGGGGKLLDTVTFEVSELDKVHRDVIVIGDPGDRAARAQLEAFSSGGKTKYAFPVTSAALDSMSSNILILIEEQRLTNLLLNRLAADNLTTSDLEDI